jgi:hypothetical protein
MVIHDGAVVLPQDHQNQRPVVEGDGIPRIEPDRQRSWDVVRFATG